MNFHAERQFQTKFKSFDTEKQAKVDLLKKAECFAVTGKNPPTS